MADITPLEPPVDSFMSDVQPSDVDTKSTTSKGEILASLQTHTPPETPELPHVSTIAADVGQDRPLFPDSPPRDPSRSLSPLIRSYEQLSTSIDRNEQEQSSERFHGSSFDQYRQTEATTFPAILGINNAQDALDYHRSLMEEQRRLRRELAFALPPPARSAKGSRRDATSSQQVSRLNGAAAICKPRAVAATRPAPRPTATTSTPPPRKASAPKKNSATKSTSAPKRDSARPKATSEGPSDSSHGQKKHTRAAPTKNVASQEWRAIEDITPPLSILDGKTHEIKWDGNKRDISEEPDIEFLHPLEVRWASKLRLDPGQYIATKRLIFNEKLRFLRAGKNFSKTAAQQVAKLDVNKLSRLHEAFEAVGWFDEKWFHQYLESVAAQ